ncbi:MAG: hypothetical protein N2170_08480 [Bacteroidia bacterium]|nr:hypothetical protein [Bacteroidia bacterium]
MAALSDAGGTSVSFLSGAFTPEWLYWEGRLLHRPTLILREGIPQAVLSTPLSESIYLPGLLSPAWVNAHTHIELCHLRGKLSQGRGMVDFFSRMGPQRGVASVEEIVYALQQAAAEGTWSFVSHQNVWLPVEGVAGGIECRFLGEYFGLRLRGSRKRFYSIRRLGYPLTPHSFYALSRPLLRQGRRFTPFPRSIHFWESWEERLWLERAGGPFRFYFRLFTSRPRPPKWKYWLAQWARRAPAIWLIHATEAPPDLVDGLSRKIPNVYFVLCPEANTYLFRRRPILQFWRKYRGRLLLGTDSLANAPSLSVWFPLRRLLLAGFSWEEVLQAVVDTPRQWLSPPPHWVYVSPLGPGASLLPHTKPQTLSAEVIGGGYK